MIIKLEYYKDIQNLANKQNDQNTNKGLLIRLDFYIFWLW